MPSISPFLVIDDNHVKSGSAPELRTILYGSMLISDRPL
jgi:hypothetical protein